MVVGIQGHHPRWIHVSAFPFVDFEYDYAAKIGLELERWDGQIKRYEGTSSGTVQYKLFGATPVMIDELKGHVTEACLTELTAQLVHDTTLYLANSAPVPGPDSYGDCENPTAIDHLPHTLDCSRTDTPLP